MREANSTGDRPRRKRRKTRAASIPAVAPSSVVAVGERRPRRALLGGAMLLLLGLAMVGIGPSEVGQWVTLGALLVLIWGIHAFGRLGPA